MNRFVCLVTPKSYDRISSVKLPPDTVIIKVVPCIDIYINMLGGWTSDECDNTAYLISEERFNEINNKKLFNLKLGNKEKDFYGQR